jgi:hypothetical protein
MNRFEDSGRLACKSTTAALFGKSRSAHTDIPILKYVLLSGLVHHTWAVLFSWTILDAERVRGSGPGTRHLGELRLAAKEKECQT